jgi:hypothetical protein
MIIHMTGISRVLPLNHFPHTFWGWGCGGLVYLHILCIWVTEPGLVPAPGLGACVSGGVCACAAPLWVFPPTLCRSPFSLC